MIVICTKCQAKFRVADDKIGPRGAKVRCSRCQTVFLVHPDLGTLPVTDGETRAPRRGEGGREAAEARPPASDEPTFTASLLPPARNVVAQPSEDPFAPAPADPFAPAAEPDPFAAPPEDRGSLAAATTAADPFAAPGADPFGEPAAPPPPDPFGDPFADAASPRSTLPVTDLADLFGASAPAPPPREPVIAPPPDDGGLALEDRLTPPPVKVRSPPELPLETAEPSLELGELPDPFAALVAQPPRAERELAAALPPPLPAPVEAEPEPVETPPPPAAAAAGRHAARIPPHPPPAPEPAARIPDRTSRLRSVAVNAVALVALLVVTLAIWAIWRSDGPFDVASLRPSAILASLRGGGPSADPYPALDVRSGVYERERGAPLVFVRGRIVSRARSAVPAVKVSVELFRDGQVIARGAAIAGGVPTAEELYGAGDATALAAALAAARARAPAKVRPGDAVPFLVAIGDAPADLEGATLRVEVAPAGGASP